MDEKGFVTAGVIGAGMMGHRYIGNLVDRFPVIRVKSVCSARMDSARALAAEYGLTACSLEEMLGDPEIQLVLVLTPACTHEEIIRKALESGKHVYTEKTMTIDAASARELARLADAKGLYLGSAPDTFLGASLQVARKAIDEGLIGEVTSFTAAATRENEELLSRFDFLRTPGAGICYDYAVYYMTAIVSLLGPVEAAAAFVSAPYPTHVNHNPKSPLFNQVMDTPNESEVSAILRLRSGVTGTFNMCADTVGQDQASFSVYGTKGILRLGDPNQFGCPVRLKQGDREEELPVSFPHSRESRGLGAADLAEALLTGRRPRADKSMALHVEEVLSAILESGETGHFVEIASRCDRPAPMPEKTGD